MRTKILLSILSIFLLGIGACDTELSLDSLCILEIPEGNDVKLDQIVCWVDKEEGIGYTIREVNEFFALNEVDLRKITDRLNECQKLEKTISTSGSLDTTTK